MYICFDDSLIKVQYINSWKEFNTKPHKTDNKLLYNSKLVPISFPFPTIFQPPKDFHHNVANPTNQYEKLSSTSSQSYICIQNLCSCTKTASYPRNKINFIFHSSHSCILHNDQSDLVRSLGVLTNKRHPQQG